MPNTKKLTRILFFGSVLLAIALMVLFGLRPNEKKVSFTIFSINDPHSHILPVETGGLGAIDALIKKEREKLAPGSTLFLFEGGDMVVGMSTKFLADSPEYGMMKDLGFDAGVLGNHEFDGGSQLLRDLTPPFPIFASNLVFEDGELEKKFLKTAIIEKNGIKLGVFGFVVTHLKSSVKDLSGVFVSQDLSELAAGYVKELNEKGVNAIIAVNHIGLSEDIDLAKSVAGIHAIVGGHSHDPVFDKTVVEGPGGWKTIVGQAGYYGRWLGRYDIEIINGKLGAADWKLISADAVSLDERIVALAQKQLDAMAKEVGLDHSFVFEFMETLDVSSKLMRTRENALGNMVAEAMRYAAGSQIGFCNGGAIRLYRVQPAGPITIAEMLEMLPFGNRMFKITTSGAEIRRQMEGSAVHAEKGGGDFLQIAGLRVAFDMSAEAAKLDENGKPSGGSRVVELLVDSGDGNFVPVEDEKNYTVALSDYLVKRWEFSEKEILPEKNDILVVDRYCGAVIDRKFYPKTDGRISFR